MSYEGYEQLVCENGHYWELDAHLSSGTLKENKCPHCKGDAAWSNAVDQTNSDGSEFVVKLSERTPAVVETCEHCNSSKEIDPPTYHIPKKPHPVHPNYGPCDMFEDDGMCAVCLELIQNQTNELARLSFCDDGHYVHCNLRNKKPSECPTCKIIGPPKTADKLFLFNKQTSSPVVVLDLHSFSICPGPKYRSEGAHSAHEYLEDIIAPLLEEGKTVIVDLDGVKGISSSFIEGLFGDAVRRYGQSAIQRLIPRAVTNLHRAEKAAKVMTSAQVF